MESPQTDPSDEELSEIIDADAPDAAVDSDDGIVEAGVPPPLNSESEESDPNDEKFGLDDFEESNKPSVEDEHSKNENIAERSPVNSESLNQNSANGSVAEFRETLSDLSRQIELDRITFLHQKALESGKQVVSLDDIASDINGSSLLFPKGDCDIYDDRPSSRLEGWVVGLSFGANRRAKKFSK